MATQTDFRVNNGLVVNGNTFVVAVVNTATRNTNYTIGQFVFNTDWGGFETYYSNTAGSEWVALTPSVVLPFGDYGNLTKDFSFLANETQYADVYDCSSTPSKSIATFDLNI
jgi:hypothetical protein